MSTLYDGNGDNYPVQIQLPSDGDPKDASSVNAAFEGLADRTESLRAAIGMNTAEPGAPTVRVHSGGVYHSSQWSHEGNSARNSWIQNSTGGFIYFPLTLPDGVTLDGVTIYLKGAAGHDPALAGITKPILTVWRNDPSSGGGDVALALGVSDPQTTDTGYQAVHSISSGALAHTVNSESNSYYARLAGEAGGSFILGLLVYGVIVQHTAA